MKIINYLKKYISKDGSIPSEEKAFLYKMAMAFDEIGEEAFEMDCFSLSGFFSRDNSDDLDLKDEKLWQRFLDNVHISLFVREKKIKKASALVEKFSFEAIKKPETKDVKQIKIVKGAKELLDAVVSKKNLKNSIVIMNNSYYKSDWGKNTCPNCKKIAGFIIKKICKNCGNEHQT